MISPSITLNNDVLRQIFYYFDVRDVIAWSLVSKQFYTLSNDPNLWKSLTENHLITAYSPQKITNHILTPKQLFFTILQNKFMDADVSKRLVVQRETLTGPLSSNSKKSPITQNGKCYSIVETYESYNNYQVTGYYKIKIKDIASNVGRTISLNSRSVEYVWPNENTFIYTQKGNNEDEIMLLDINIDHNPSLFNDKGTQTRPMLICTEKGIEAINVEFLNGHIHIQFKSQNKPEEVTKLVINNSCNYIPHLTKVLKSLESVNKNENPYQIFTLKYFLPSTVTIPTAFMCSLKSTLMLNPVRDLCTNQGHVFEKETILQQFSIKRGKEAIGTISTAPCPISRQVMPKLQTTSLRHTFDTHYHRFSFEDGQTVTTPTETYTTLCRVDSQEALIHDEKLQTEILEWLKKEIFETHFDSLPPAAKNSICHSSTMDENIKALYYFLIENTPQPTCIPAPFEDEMEKIFTQFSFLPSAIKDSIYSHLLPNAPKDVAEETFYDRNGKTSSITEKAKALRRYRQELQITFLSSEMFK